MEKRQSRLKTTPPIVCERFGSEYRRRLAQLNRLDHDARLIALRVLRPTRAGFESSPVFLDLYEIARDVLDVLVRQSLRKK